MSDPLSLPPGWPAADLDTVHARLTAPGAPFEMTEAEVGGQRLRVYRHAPDTLRDLLLATASLGERTAIVFQDERLDYASLHARVRALAWALRVRHGIEPGDRVAIAMRNYPEWVIAFWAITSCGAIAVLLNGWWSGTELAFGIEDSGARLVIADAERAARIQAAMPGAARPPMRVTRGDPPAGADGLLTDLLGDDPGELPATVLEPDDVAVLLYTSGTTGQPKAAAGTHRNIISNLFNRRYGAARAALRRGADMPPSGLSPAPRPLLATVPLFHVTGCHSLMVPTIASGDTLVLMYRWDAAEAARLVERERVVTLSGVPHMVWQLLEVLERGDAPDMSALQSITWGGTPAGGTLIGAVRSRLPGVHTGNGYGMTETASLISQASAEDHVLRPDSVGRPVPVCDVRIAAADGTPLAGGEVGEIQVRGPQVMAGYWGRPGATRAALPDGWLRTGDLGRVDDDGFLYVVDRLKDIIIRGGENVAGAIVEEQLLDHPAVLEAAVIGAPHPTLGEEVAAVVRVTPGTALTGAALASFLGPRLAGFEIPAHWHLQYEALPRNPGGKIIKTALRAALAADGGPPLAAAPQE